MTLKIDDITSQEITQFGRVRIRFKVEPNIYTQYLSIDNHEYCQVKRHQHNYIITTLSLRVIIFHSIKQNSGYYGFRLKYNKKYKGKELYKRFYSMDKKVHQNVLIDIIFRRNYLS